MESGASGAPTWPLVSIVVLCCLSAMADPIVLTALSGTFLLVAGVVIIGSNQRVELRLGHVLVPFGLILCTGLASASARSATPTSRTPGTFSNPAMVILTGYLLYKLRPDLAAGLRAFVLEAC
jgi:hypothetical protein